MTVYLKDILHAAAQGLLIPVMIVLVLLIAYALFCIGSVVTEYVTERRHFRAHMPRVINAIHDADYADVNAVIADSALLIPQKEALTMVASNMGLPDDDLFALAKTEVSKVEETYQRIVGRNDLVTKVAPMMGLMATLIPLGPGIVAMGQADVNQLAQSLLIAFDGTVAGLVAAVVSMVVGKVRKRWYAQYSSAMEALMTCLLEKASEARKAGVELPYGYEGVPEATRARGFFRRAGAQRSDASSPAVVVTEASAPVGATARPSVLSEER